MYYIFLEFQRDSPYFFRFSKIQNYHGPHSNTYLARSAAIVVIDYRPRSSTRSFALRKKAVGTRRSPSAPPRSRCSLCYGTLSGYWKGSTRGRTPVFLPLAPVVPRGGRGVSLPKGPLPRRGRCPDPPSYRGSTTTPR